MSLPKVTRVGVGNAIKAVGRIVKAASDKDAKILLELKERDRRRSVCNAPCPNNSNNQCLLCECNITLKTMLTTETCPDNRW